MDVKSYWKVYMDFRITLIPVGSVQHIAVLWFEGVVVRFSAHEVGAYDRFVIDCVFLIQVGFLIDDLDFNAFPRYLVLEAFDYGSLGILCVERVGAQVLLILSS